MKEEDDDATELRFFTVDFGAPLDTDGISGASSKLISSSLKKSIDLSSASASFSVGAGG